MFKLRSIVVMRNILKLKNKRVSLIKTKHNLIMKRKVMTIYLIQFLMSWMHKEEELRLEDTNQVFIQITIK